LWVVSERHGWSEAISDKTRFADAIIAARIAVCIHRTGINEVAGLVDAQDTCYSK